MVELLTRGWAMTEAEWFAAPDWRGLERMLEAVREGCSVRKARLLTAACCRIHASYLTPPRHTIRDAFLDRMEGLADDISITNWIVAVEADESEAAKFETVEGCSEIAEFYTLVVPNMGLLGSVTYATHVDPGSDNTFARDPQAHLLRCIFGNPFRPVAFSPGWLTPTVTALAEAIYADRAFDRLPILADALEEAGCDHPDVLAHCRGTGPHARGCWVVDGVLGKN